MPAKKLVVSTYLQYILIVLGVILLIGFVRQIGGVLLTFLLAALLAYVLNPLVRRLEELRVPRVLAVVGVFLTLILIVVAALLVLIIPAVGQVQNLIENPQSIVKQASGLVERARELPYLGEYVGSFNQQAATKLLQSNAPSAGQALKGASGFIGGVFGVFGTLLNLILMLIISIYLLLEREKIIRGILNVIPDTVRDQAVELLHAVEATLVKYLKAQLTLCAIMGVIGAAIGFFAIGRYALIIGLWVALTEIIPVLGAFLGAVPAILIALFTGGFTQALIVAGLFLLAQQLEGNILVPRIMGGSVGVHPLWVLFATLAATALYGVIGAVFAVPIVAIIAATFRYFRNALIFERWNKALIAPTTVRQEAEPDTRGSSSAHPEERSSRARDQDREERGPEKGK